VDEQNEFVPWKCPARDTGGVDGKGDRTLPGSEVGREVANDVEANYLLQRKYAQAQIASGNVPPEIMAKLRRMQELSAKQQQGKATNEEAKLALDLALEIAPHFHFLIADVNQNKQ
jgi:hypothetical protein